MALHSQGYTEESSIGVTLSGALWGVIDWHYTLRGTLRGYRLALHSQGHTEPLALHITLSGAHQAVTLGMELSGALGGWHSTKDVEQLSLGIILSQSQPGEVSQTLRWVLT